MQVLAPREALVLRLRFGATGRAHTREEVARKIGVSPATVGRIERSALRKLRLGALGPVSSGWQGWDEV